MYCTEPPVDGESALHVQGRFAATYSDATSGLRRLAGSPRIYAGVVL
ncbi:MAG TPA: hypothetical protein VKK79_00265 [Candidatus Lokiarchaeia archaeon]|nr:hypothetical protein [Candidatus Lokiarchaeia archaeon]